MTPQEIRLKYALRKPETIHILQFFADSHLTSQLRLVALAIQELTFKLVDETTDGPELIVALRKLLDAKESFFRHYVVANNFYTLFEMKEKTDGSSYLQK